MKLSCRTQKVQVYYCCFAELPLISSDRKTAKNTGLMVAIRGRCNLGTNLHSMEVPPPPYLIGVNSLASLFSNPIRAEKYQSSLSR